MKRLLSIIITAVAAISFYGCGGDSSGGSSVIVPDTQVLPAGKATLAFSAISTARLDTSIGGITMALKLPAGISVATESGTSRIVTGDVVPGSALSGTNLAFGSYSASIRQAKLTMATSGSSYRSGEFLRLTCTVDPGSSITVAALKALNTPVALIKAAGYDAATTSTVDLTGKVRLSVDVVK